MEGRSLGEGDDQINWKQKRGVFPSDYRNKPLRTKEGMAFQ